MFYAFLLVTHDVMLIINQSDSVRHSVREIYANGKQPFMQSKREIRCISRYDVILNQSECEI